MPALIVFFIVRGVIRASKPKYLPAIAQVEGGGIKRGLTAPESAVILELPLTKVLILVVFGMLEKGLIRQTKDDPLTVEVVEEFRVKDKPNLTDAKAKKNYRNQLRNKRGPSSTATSMRFLDLFEDNPDSPIKALKIVGPMQGLANQDRGKDEGI